MIDHHGGRQMRINKGAAHLLLVLILAVKGALLLALLAGDGRPVLLLRVGAPLALVPDEGRDDVAVLAGC